MPHHAEQCYDEDGRGIHLCDNLSLKSGDFWCNEVGSLPRDEQSKDPVCMCGGIHYRKREE